ncbi:hypothetical protein [Candidatus Bandiella euplotis]|uniref:hypothetical protein n=1 Tax=Candidatus Bandiella euplotis TaxID=1664265 RepID=UPI002B25F4A2|nr:hypothetical protein [Candidatus Bandiella woodruffii]
MNKDRTDLLKASLESNDAWIVSREKSMEEYTDWENFKNTIRTMFGWEKKDTALLTQYIKTLKKALCNIA